MHQIDSIENLTQDQNKSEQSSFYKMKNEHMTRTNKKITKYSQSFSSHEITHTHIHIDTNYYIQKRQDKKKLKHE